MLLTKKTLIYYHFYSPLLFKKYIFAILLNSLLFAVLFLTGFKKALQKLTTLVKDITGFLVQKFLTCAVAWSALVALQEHS